MQRPGIQAAFRSGPVRPRRSEARRDVPTTTTSASTRAGRFLRQPGGYETFIPRPLRPGLLERDPELDGLLSAADRAIGRLDGVSTLLPNPDLFVTMYSRKEALLSSQIEGTRASLVDVLEYEAESRRRPHPDVLEVVNHLRAMEHGLERLGALPLSNRLLREIHEVLMRGVRGGRRRVGEFRRSQNWIGPPGSSIEEADFVPPPVPEMRRAMGELETYIHEDRDTPILLQAGLVHYQFETIHPFEDGNGRMGRLLITFMLAEREVLSRPLLYLSVYFRRHRGGYYDCLDRVRLEGDYEGWIKFFLRGVREVCLEATETARRVLRMREEHLERVRAASTSGHAPRLLELLLLAPALTATEAARRLDVSYPTANNLIARFGELGLLEEITGRQRDRVFLYGPYIEVLGGAYEPEAAEAPPPLMTEGAAEDRG